MTTARRRPRGRVLGVAVMLAATHARSDALPDDAQLSIERCEDADEIRRIVAIELGGASGPARGESRGERRVRASVVCTADTVTVIVEDDVGRAGARQVLSLASEPHNARARLIALTLVELMSGGGREPSPVAASTDRPDPGTTADVRAADLPPSPRNRPVLGVHLGTRRYRDTGLLIGGGIAARRGGRFGWRADLEAHRGGADVSLGTVATTVADVGAYLDVALVRGRTRVGAHAGARGGVARLAGTPATMEATAGDVTGAWFGALAGATLDVAIGDRIGLTIVGEVGAVLVPVTGLVGARPEAAVDGAWIAVHLGLRVIP